MNDQINNLKVAIGIPTFKRPEGLRRLLESLAQTRAPFTPHIIVADNEGENGAGMKVVTLMIREGYPFPLVAVPVKERGISQARNALLELAFDVQNADYLAMVDDDERVEADWIFQLVSMQQETGADVVWGYVIPEFETPPPTWCKGLAIYYRDKLPDGNTTIIGGSGHSLITKTCYSGKNKKTNLFNHDFSVSGGEDSHFFQKLQNDGAAFAFASKAVSYEYYPDSRIKKTWALQRSFRTGVTDIAIRKLFFTKNLRKFYAKEILTLTAAMGKGLLISIFYFWSPEIKMQGMSLVARQLGKIAGFFGYKHQEYKSTHGR